MTDPLPPADPPAQPYPQPQYGPYPQYSPPMNVFAILALIFGVFVLPPLGIYFGYKAKQQIAQTGERGSELATVGIIVGWIFTGMYVLICGVGALFIAFGIAANANGY